jgi:hypothetical protein
MHPNILMFKQYDFVVKKKLTCAAIFVVKLSLRSALSKKWTDC